MSGQFRRWVAVWIVCLVMAGCGEPTERLNAPPQGQAEYNSELQPFFTYQADNAMMSDLNLTDIHFVPHTAELNSLGTARLTRIGKLIETYGGTVRYTTRLADVGLVDQRMEHMREFLRTTGIDTTSIEVAVAQAGANYAPATEAIKATEKGMAASSSSGEDGGMGGAMGSSRQ